LTATSSREVSPRRQCRDRQDRHVVSHYGNEPEGHGPFDVSLKDPELVTEHSQGLDRKVVEYTGIGRDIGQAGHRNGETDQFRHRYPRGSWVILAVS
jgi:hypothetical protein